MMKIDEVREALYRELAPQLPGWKLVKKERAFVRPVPAGKQEILLSLIDYRPEYRFAPVMVTRLDPVEDLFALGVGLKGPGETLTSMTQIEYFFPDHPPPKQYIVHDEAELHAAVAELAPVLRDKILPFFDAHRDVAAFDAALNGGDPRLDTSDPTSRNMHALVVAHLAGNPRFEELVTRYEAAMESFPAMSKQRFAKLVGYLRSLRAS